jgi:hypothetical protein
MVTVPNDTVEDSSLAEGGEAIRAEELLEHGGVFFDLRIGHYCVNDSPVRVIRNKKLMYLS